MMTYIVSSYKQIVGYMVRFRNRKMAIMTFLQHAVYMCVCVCVCVFLETKTGLIKESNYCKCQMNGGVLLISILKLTKIKLVSSVYYLSFMTI